MYQVLKPVRGHIQCRGIERTFVSCRYPDTLCLKHLIDLPFDVG
jgi:hypothetical protein